MLRVYLSGAMGGRLAADVIDERQKAAELCLKYNLFPVDPGRNEKQHWGKKISINLSAKQVSQFIEKDLMLIRRSDILLVLTGDTPSDGTWIEKTYAKMVRLPVVMVSPLRYKNEVVGWSNLPYWTDAVFPSTLAAVKYIDKKWGKGA